MVDEIKQKVRDLTHGEIESWLQEHGVEEFPAKQPVPEDINPETTSLEQAFEYEQNRLNNDRRKVKFYFFCLRGWEEEADYCNCGASHWYDCSCSDDEKEQYYDFMKKQQLQLLDEGERYSILRKMKSRFSEDDSPENLPNVLNQFPLLEKKLVHMAG